MVVVPIPIIAPVQGTACDGLGDQLLQRLGVLGGVLRPDVVVERRAGEADCLFQVVGQLGGELDHPRVLAGAEGGHRVVERGLGQSGQGEEGEGDVEARPNAPCGRAPTCPRTGGRAAASLSPAP